MGLDQAAIESLRAMILAGDVGSWPSAICAPARSRGLAWSGNPAHLRSVAATLERAAHGLEDYLVIRAPGGLRHHGSREYDCAVRDWAAGLEAEQ